MLSWLTAWRPSVLWLTVAAIAVGLYVAGLRRMRARGDRWPAGRTVSWLLGWLLFTWATSGAPGLYSNVLFSMHMAEHMALAMAVPILLVLGAPARWPCAPSSHATTAAGVRGSGSTAVCTRAT